MSLTHARNLYIQVFLLKKCVHLMGHNKVGILYFNVANSNKSENLAVSCQ